MKILITGGGTGGHVNPAIAVANEIRSMEPDCEIAFVGTSRGIENKLVPKEGYRLYHIEIQGLYRRLTLKNIKTAWLFLTSPIAAGKLINEFRPDLVFGTGGYVCYPIIKAAAKRGIPTALHESNAYPGVAVRMLERFVDRIYVNFDKTADYLRFPEKVMKVGNPIRKEFYSLSYGAAREKLGISGKFRTFILSCGGSMGAMRINSEIIDVMKTYSSKNSDVLHIHAAGSIEYEDTRRQFTEAGLDKYDNLKLVEYIYNMPEMMAAADIVINRAGAMTLSELAALGKPAILIPSPNVTDNHQYKNAKVLSDAGAAVLLEESELSDGRLAGEVNELVRSRKKRCDMSESISRFAINNTAEIIYSGLKALVISGKK